MELDQNLLIFVAKVVVQYELMDQMAEFPNSNPGFVLALQHGKASHSHFLVGKVRVISSSVFCRILAPQYFYGIDNSWISIHSLLIVWAHFSPLSLFYSFYSGCEGSVTEHQTLHRHSCAEKMLSSSWWSTHTVDREGHQAPVLQRSYLWILCLLWTKRYY